MNILYLHQYFKVPSEPGGTRSYWIAKALIKNGHEVIMITSKNLNGKKKEEVSIDGIKVIYLSEAYDQNMSVCKRLKAFLNFVWKSTLVANDQKNIDLVVATSTPLTIGIPALFLKWKKNIPYLFEVRDLWPEVPIQMGVINNPFLKWLTRKFEKTIYKNAEHVIGLSPGMQKGILKYIPKEKTTMIPNMAKKDEFWPRKKNTEFEIKLGLKTNSFKIIHFGSLGLANGANTIIESAKLLKEDDSFEFLFVGGGSTEEYLKDECSKNELNNVKFLGSFSMKDTSEIVNFSDVSIVSFKDIPILYTNSPNKFFDSLSAGKPIIVNSAGWTKDLIEKHECGYYVNPSHPHELVYKLKHLQSHPEIVRSMGDNSRKLAEDKYDKSILSRQFVDVINGLLLNKNQQ
jgi:glycosyltransferase involved in cell wall biosynthesis